MFNTNEQLYHSNKRNLGWSWSWWWVFSTESESQDVKVEEKKRNHLFPSTLRKPSRRRCSKLKHEIIHQHFWGAVKKSFLTLLCFKFLVLIESVLPQPASLASASLTFSDYQYFTFYKESLYARKIGNARAPVFKRFFLFKCMKKFVLDNFPRNTLYSYQLLILRQPAN